jgi:hypothetical protein
MGSYEKHGPVFQFSTTSRRCSERYRYLPLIERAGLATSAGLVVHFLTDPPTAVGDALLCQFFSRSLARSERWLFARSVFDSGK